MKFSMPQEVEVWYVIPAIRREFTFELNRRGCSHKKIAEYLGVTEAAVSQYLKHKRATNLKFNSRVGKAIYESVDRLLNKSSAISEIQKICNILKKDLTICEIHRNYDHSLPKDCKFCMVK